MQNSKIAHLRTRLLHTLQKSTKAICYNITQYHQLIKCRPQAFNLFSFSSARDSEQILSSSSYGCPGGPENSNSAWCSVFPARNIFSKDIDRWSKDPANYWLTENGKVGEEQGFIMSLECQKTVVGVNLRNTQNAEHRDRSTKKFRILGSADKNGPWQELLLANLEDSRLQDPPPFQQLMLPNSAVVSFVKFELLEYYGLGGGLQFFEVTGKV